MESNKTWYTADDWYTKIDGIPQDEVIMCCVEFFFAKAMASRTGALGFSATWRKPLSRLVIELCLDRIKVLSICDSHGNMIPTLHGHWLAFLWETGYKEKAREILKEQIIKNRPR